MKNTNIQTSTSFLVYKELAEKYKLHLTDEQIQTIDDVYIEERKLAVFKVGMYRFINLSISIVVLFILLVVPGSESKLISVSMFSIYGIYSLIHCWNNLMDYKSIRKTNFKPFRVEPK